VRFYQRPADTVFPTGPYHKGGSYGEDVNLPIPIEEQNNPNFTACLTRDP
jgi:starch-binding outer membrane protein, SusD/RagB family